MTCPRSSVITGRPTSSRPSKNVKSQTISKSFAREVRLDVGRLFAHRAQDLVGYALFQDDVHLRVAHEEAAQLGWQALGGGHRDRVQADVPLRADAVLRHVIAQPISQREQPPRVRQRGDAGGVNRKPVLSR
jgi:hypothetical protein